MNAVGIDVSKGKSVVTILRPFGEVVASPVEVCHTDSALGELADTLKGLSGETKVIMENTGGYHLPIAYFLHEAGLTVCVVNALIIHNYGNNTIRKVKSDSADALKIANYGLSHWLELSVYVPENEIRHMLKAYSRQYNKYMKVKTALRNNLISLTDQVFPGVNELFSSPDRKSDGHRKWVDFVIRFWHPHCISLLSQKAFTTAYRNWCKSSGYNFSTSKAEDIYIESLGHINILPKNESTKMLITSAAKLINSISEIAHATAAEMKRLASLLPEYPIVMDFYGVGDILGPQIMAEIGDIYRFPKKSSLVCFAGLEPVENSSGKFRGDERISKQGSPHLRRALFLVMDCILMRAPANDPIFAFIDRKRTEGKHYYSYMAAGAAKFLRIYYARVKEHLDEIYP